MRKSKIRRLRELILLAGVQVLLFGVFVLMDPVSECRSLNECGIPGLPWPEREVALAGCLGGGTMHGRYLNVLVDEEKWTTPAGCDDAFYLKAVPISLIPYVMGSGEGSGRETQRRCSECVFFSQVDEGSAAEKMILVKGRLTRHFVPMSIFKHKDGGPKDGGAFSLLLSALGPRRITDYDLRPRGAWRGTGGDLPR